MLTAAELAQLPEPLRDAILRKVAEERSRKTEPRFIAGLHPHQKAFVLDPSKRKCALAGRRAGKSEGIAAWLLQDADQYPGELSPFIARTAGHAKRILWPTLRRIDTRHKLGLKFNAQDLTVTTPGGHVIWLSGAKDFSEIEKFRGPRYRRVAIDEAGTFPSDLLEYLIDDILDPALMDLDGELALCGTPGAVPAGYFYARTTGDHDVLKQWPTHHWTCLDNPHVNGAKYIARKKRENAWADDNPTLRREYYAAWILDALALVLPYQAQRNGELFNAFYELPTEGDWTYGLCIDLGAGDSERSTSFTIGAIRKNHPEFYVCYSEKRSGMIPSSIAARAEQLMREWKTRVLVLDEGGLGVGYGEEFRRTYGLGFIPAEKSKKKAFLELVHGDVISGLFKAHPFKARELIGEMQVAQWNEDRSDIDDRFVHHAMDGAVYLARAMVSRYRPELEPPDKGSPAWWEAERQRMRKAAEQRVLKRARGGSRWR